MDEPAVKTIKDGFRNLRTTIPFMPIGDPFAVVKRAIAEDPAVAYYLKTYSLFRTFGGYEVRAQYYHTDTPRIELRMISSIEECVELIRQRVSGFQKKLVVISVGGVNMTDALTVFKAKYATLFPNMTDVFCSNYQFVPRYVVFEFEFFYRADRETLLKMEREVEREVGRVSALLFKKDMPAEVKIYLAHNYLASTVEYLEYEKSACDPCSAQSAYGALIKKKCVCQGFAEAFKRLMDAAGVECFAISGDTAGSDVLHSWNIVSLGNGKGYYHIDVTWDAVDEKPTYMYFCKRDAFFAGKRTWNRTYAPKCEGTYPVLAAAQRYVFANRAKLLSYGISGIVLG